MVSLPFFFSHTQLAAGFFLYQTRLVLLGLLVLLVDLLNLEGCFELAAVAQWVVL